jgi:enoyl-CoA hydratase/carnithine racemase
VRIGVAAAIIAVPILRRVAPSAIATAMLTGAPFDTSAAQSMHLVDVVTDDVGAAVTAIVDGIRAGAPDAVAATKALLQRVPRLERDAAFAEMQSLSEALFAGPAAREGMAAFAEKRTPRWAVAS